MEPKEKQVKRVADRLSNAVQMWWPWLMDLGLVVLVVLVLAALMGCRSTTAAYGTQHTTRDSVAIRYKTVLRDSIRIKDSTVVSFSTVQRDSVVLRVDAETGKVVGKDTWHWRDTNKDRDHIAEVGEMAVKADSVARERVNKDSVATIQQPKQKAAEVKKTHYWRTWWLGMLAGIALSLGWKYRKKILGMITMLC